MNPELPQSGSAQPERLLNTIVDQCQVVLGDPNLDALRAALWKGMTGDPVRIMAVWLDVTDRALKAAKELREMTGARELLGSSGAREMGLTAPGSQAKPASAGDLREFEKNLGLGAGERNVGDGVTGNRTL